VQLLGVSGQFNVHASVNRLFLEKTPIFEKGLRRPSNGSSRTKEEPTRSDKLWNLSHVLSRQIPGKCVGTEILTRVSCAASFVQRAIAPKKCVAL
jgi:hypothetical protein